MTFSSTAAGIPFPSPAEVAGHISRALGDRISRTPSIGTVVPKVLGRALGAIGMMMTPSPAGINSDIANPALWLSSGQQAWVNQVAGATGVPVGMLQHNLATAHREGLTADPSYVMSDAEYDRIANDTINQATAAGQMAAPVASGPTPGNVRITRVLAATLGACAVLACPPPVDGFGGGAHACTSQPPGDGKDSHHMPADSATAMPKAMGPAIRIDVADHVRTPSYGGGALGPGYAIQRQLIQSGRAIQAFELDAAAVEAIAPGKYTASIAQARAYALCLQAHGLLR